MGDETSDTTTYDVNLVTGDDGEKYIDGLTVTGPSGANDEYKFRPSNYDKVEVARKAAEDAAAKANSTNDTVKKAEAERVSNFEAAQTERAEKFDAAEKLRASGEETRKSNEQTRAQNEDARKRDEETRRTQFEESKGACETATKEARTARDACDAATAAAKDLYALGICVSNGRICQRIKKKEG